MVFHRIFTTTGEVMMSDEQEPGTKLSRENFLLYSLPAFTGLAGGLFAWYVGGTSLGTLMGAITLTLIGAISGWTLFSQHRRQLNQLTSGNQKHQQEQLTAIHAYINELEKLYLKVTPILLRQVQSSRFHTEREITTLTEQFGAMASQLEQIISSSAHIKSANLNDTLNTLMEETKNTFDSLNQIVETEQAVNDEAKHLTAHIAELDLMHKHIKTSEQELNQLAAKLAQTADNNAQSPAEISKLTHVLSASIEKVSQTNHNLNAILQSASGLLTNSIYLNDKNVLNAKSSLNNALMQLKSILSIYKSNADMLRASSKKIHHEICAVLVAFQFQDRVSQMLAQVENNLACLDETLQLTRNQGNKRDADMINIEQTLQQMKLDYSMPEQHANHTADEAVQGKLAQDDELTFF
jgi:methyl-accepting chemotaxis protein